MKKKISNYLIVVTVMLLLLGMTVGVSAATTSDPLEKMPAKYYAILDQPGKVIHFRSFSTPRYKTPVKISIVSSNTKVAEVEKKEFGDAAEGYGASGVIYEKGPGTATVTVKVTVNKKTYTKKCICKFYRYECPFDSISIQGNDYLKNVEDTASYNNATMNGGDRINIDVGNGYRLDAIEVAYGYSGYGYKNKFIRNGAKLPYRPNTIWVYLTNIKTQTSFWVILADY